VELSDDVGRSAGIPLRATVILVEMVEAQLQDLHVTGATPWLQCLILFRPTGNDIQLYRKRSSALPNTSMGRVVSAYCPPNKILNTELSSCWYDPCQDPR
jgi:hypothetical protein